MTPRAFRALFPEFQAPSWRAWASVVDAIFGESPDDPDLVRRLAGGRSLPTRPVKEFWAACGRGAGKSRQAAFIACYMAFGRAFPRVPGESVFVHVVAPDRRQSAVTLGYIRGLIFDVPALRRLVTREVRDGLELATGIVIEVGTADPATERGRAFGLVVIEEAAQLPRDQSANPDLELFRAVRPGLARVAGSLLCVLFSPYAMAGETWRMYHEHFGQNDPDRLIIQAPTLVLNPGFDQTEIARAHQEDPLSAAREYDAKFLSGVAALLDHAAVRACVPAGVRERPPSTDATVRVGHVDPATGSGSDAWAAAVAELRGDVATLLAVREWRPPFDPSQVAAECASLFKTYGLSDVSRDQFAGGLVDDLMRRAGVDVRRSDLDTSGAYLRLVSLVNCRRVELVDHPGLVHQLCALERRCGPSGRDRVVHPVAGHDDLAAAAAAALVAAAAEADAGQGIPVLFVSDGAGGDDERHPVAADGADPDDEAVELNAARAAEERREQAAREEAERQQLDEAQRRAAARRLAAAVRRGGGVWMPGDGWGGEPARFRR